MKQYDLCVIGGGPSGYAAVARALDFGLKVCLIEKNKLGGAGVFDGALSSKTLWELSEKVVTVNETINGSGKDKFTIEWSRAKSVMENAIHTRNSQYEEQIHKLHDESEEGHFTFINGWGSFIDKHTIKVSHEDGSSREIKANYTIIATGSKPRTLPNIDIDEEMIMTSDGIHRLEEFPKSLVILGAGVIGCEFATIFSNFGKTKVFLIDRANRVLPFEDEEISEMVANNLRAKGVVVHNEANFSRMEIKDGKVEYEISYPQGMSQVIRVEKALISVGRIPNVEGLGLENAGVKLKGGTGTHILDDDTATNVDNIFCVGDVSGHIALVNVGEIEARHAVEKIVKKQSQPISYENICTIMFLHPEVAAVGKNETACIEAGLDFKVVKLNYSKIARAIAMQQTDGFFKIIVTDDDEMKILGMRAVGPHASSAIQAVGLLIKMDKGIEVLSELVHPHPSIIEGIQECVRILLNKPLFKTFAFKEHIQYYRVRNGKKEEISTEIKRAST